MHWEGIGTPSCLLAPQVATPWGLAGWLAAHAPICPLGWTGSAEQWVSNQVLGRHAIATFRSFLEMAQANQRGGHTTWHSATASARHLPYWAIAGRDTGIYPVKLLTEKGNLSVLLALIQETPMTREHIQWHRDALYGIACTTPAGHCPQFNEDEQAQVFPHDPDSLDVNQLGSPTRRFTHLNGSLVCQC
jgi:hypothetical protein